MKRSRSVLLCIFFFLTLAAPALAQDFSNKGKEFWIAYPSHIDGASSVMGLYITSSVDTKGTVTLGNSAPVNFSVDANVVTRVFLGQTSGGGSGSVYYGSNSSVYINNITDGIQTNSAIHINAEAPVIVYAHIIKSARSGATLALPTQVLGNDYIVANMNSNSTSNATSNGTRGGISEIAVVATQDNTTVEIKPSVIAAGHSAGVPYSITLPKAGDVYQLQSGLYGDLSGTRVSSKSSGNSGCKPIAVFSASTWSTFDCSGATGGDNLLQQLFPVGSWGKTFVTAPFYNRLEDIFRIFVKDPQTTVTVQENGTVTTLGAASYNSAGGFYTYRTGNPIVIKGSDAISVTQYITSASCKTGCSTSTNTPACYGDPEMVLLNPIEQTLQDITFFSAHADYVPQGQTQIKTHYVNVIISKAFKSSVKIDNAPPKGSFVDIPNSNYSYLQEDLTASSAVNPVHRVVADTNFAALVYGYGNVESYGYNAGTNVKDFSAHPVFQTDYARIDSAVTCANTPFKLSVPVSFQPSTIKWDFSAAPNIAPSATQAPQPVQDSVVNGVYYYSPQGPFVFSKANTSALRDTIKLYTTSATPDGCGSTDQLFTIPVKVNELPVPKFAVANSGCVSEPVTFTDQSQYAGSLVKWEWDFGDGNTAARSSGAGFPKAYTNGGTYTVKLKVYSDVGCVSTETSQVIDISSKPVASFNVPALLCPGADITYTDISITTVGTLAKWAWNLDDGAGTFTNTTNAAVKTKYSSDGLKQVSLQVSTTTGCASDVFSRTVKINPLPVAGFRVPEVCLNDANAKFTDTSTLTEGSVVSYAWNFNAGSPPVTQGPQPATSTQQNPQPKYNEANHYKVSLTVTSDKGCAATSVQDFTVNGSTPKADFVFSGITPYCGNKPVQLVNQSTVDFGNVTKLELYWDINGQPGNKETDENPAGGKAYTHSYTASGTNQQYTVKMLAYSGGNTCVSELSKTVTVYPRPEAAYTVSASQLCYGGTVNFSDKSTAGAATINTWRWDLGGNTMASAQNPSHQYNDSGSIATSLVVSTADGCVSDTAYSVLTVYPNPKLEMPAIVQVLEGAIATVKPVFTYGNNLTYLWTPVTYIVGANTLSAVQVSPPDDEDMTLALTAEGGCSVTGHTLVKVLRGLEIPNGFSPNGDGINDTWRIRYLDGYPDATIEVYNRGGQIVFRSVGYSKDWDGTYQGKALPIGTYYYIINPKTGKVGIYTGSVTILK